MVITRGVDRGSGLQSVNEVHQWGHGSHVPSRVNFNSNKDATPTARWQTHDARVDIVDIAAARCHNIALDRAGMVFTWGFGADNLGERRNDVIKPVPRFVLLLSKRVSGLQLCAGTVFRKTSCHVS